MFFLLLFVINNLFVAPLEDWGENHHQGAKKMEITISKDAISLGREAAKKSANVINEAIKKKGHARIILSTGMSQFETLSALIDESVDWSKVEMFHLDVYVNLSETHIASFRKYLKERFISKVNLHSYHLVEGKEELPALIKELEKDEIDLGLIGIGENGHIAFNDPPCNFSVKDSYIVVNLSDTCKAQQVGEGWFATPSDVPAQAISMSCYRIMQCKVIVSAVPHMVKATAIKKTVESKVVTNLVPATLLKTHPAFYLFLDSESASETNFNEAISFDGRVPVINYGA